MTAKQAIASYKRIRRALEKVTLQISIEEMADSDSDSQDYSLQLECITGGLEQALEELEAEIDTIYKREGKR